MGDDNLTDGGLPADGPIYPGDPAHCLCCHGAAIEQSILRARVAELEQFEQKYHDAMAILSAWGKIDLATTLGERNEARARVAELEGERDFFEKMMARAADFAETGTIYTQQQRLALADRLNEAARVVWAEASPYNQPPSLGALERLHEASDAYQAPPEGRVTGRDMTPPLTDADLDRLRPV